MLWHTDSSSQDFLHDAKSEVTPDDLFIQISPLVTSHSWLFRATDRPLVVAVVVAGGGAVVVVG